MKNLFLARLDASSARADYGVGVRWNGGWKGENVEVVGNVCFKRTDGGCGRTRVVVESVRESILFVW